MYRINDYLTEDERREAIYAGFVTKLAEMNITPKQFEKIAQAQAAPAAAAAGAAAANKSGNGASIGDILDAALKISIIAGLPLGAVAHWVGQAATEDNAKIRKLKKTRDYYRDVADSISKNTFVS